MIIHQCASKGRTGHAKVQGSNSGGLTASKLDIDLHVMVTLEIEIYIKDGIF